MEIPDLTSAISTLQELISEDNSVVETGGSVVTKRILDLVEDQEDNDQQQVSEEKDVSTRSDRKSQVKQCLSFCTADFWSLLAYESAVQNPKHCLTCDFHLALVSTQPFPDNSASMSK